MICFENPIPLFVKQVGGRIPRWRNKDVLDPGTNKVAFDFVRGDWLPPKGKGEVADMVFVRVGRKSFGMVEMPSGLMGEVYREEMDVLFPGEGNGLMEETVALKSGLWLRSASESGYNPEYHCWSGVDRNYKKDTSYNKRRCFSFRIRTRRNEHGEIVSAYYGKIYGDIMFVCQQRPTFVSIAEPRFCYYLNPTSLDRNLEWNMVNLCKDPGELDSPQP